jgi:type VI secretion system secreted protein Hcp
MKNPSNFFFMALVAAGIFLAPFQCHAAYDIYLKLSGVSGESTNSAYLNQIVVLSFSSTETIPISIGLPGRATFGDMTITKYLDVSSPTLFLDCAKGTQFVEAVLSFQDQSTKAPAFYTIKLSNVLISSVSSGGSAGGDNRPTETVTLNFAAISWTYQQLTTTGNPVGPPVIHTWDLVHLTGT